MIRKEGTCRAAGSDQMKIDDDCGRPEGMDRHYSRAERIADGLVHAIGLALAIGACAALAALALPAADALRMAALVIYAGGLVTMLGCSAAYNLMPEGDWKNIFRRLDHAAIFLMIAGTYTPFTLVAIGGAWGWSLFGVVWAGALAGAMLKLVWPHRFERLSIAVYLLLGWVILLALGPMFANMSLQAIVLLGVGGLLYSLGVLFHLWERLKFQNAVWHAFVLAAAACHYVAVVSEVALAA
jgi:hemolysin III